MNGKVLMLAIIFLGGFHVFYVFNRVQNFANIMNRLCAIQLGECPICLKINISVTRREIWTRSTHSKNFRSAAALVTEISQFEVWCCLFFFAVTGALTFIFFSSFSFRIVSAIELCSNSTKLVRFIEDFPFTHDFHMVF